MSYAEYGDPHGMPVLYQHGLLASRFEVAFADAPARQLGLRLIAVDRPGYGGSDPQPGRSLRSWARDIAALADALQCSRFHLLGVSGGGPYALVYCFALGGPFSESLAG